jgi:FlaA1/EpsC-like NDP-sugar epimerase
MTTQQIRVAATTFTSRAGVALRRDLLTSVNAIGTYATALNRGVYSRPAQVVIDGVLVVASLSAAYLLRFDADVPAPYDRQLATILPLAVAVSLMVNGLTGVYRRIWRYFDMQDAMATAAAVALTFLISIVWRIFDPGMFAGTPVPFGVLLIFPFFAFGSMTMVRVIRRVSYNYVDAAKQARPPAARGKRLLLAGAGEAGLYLLRELRDSQFDIVGFVDDDQELQGRTIGGCRVLGTTHALEAIVRDHAVDEVILCMPSAPRAVLQRIVMRCARMSLKTSTVPTLGEIMSDHSRIGHLRPVSMEDLLGRSSVIAPEELGGLDSAYLSRRILVTGAGGSIGSELVRQLSQLKPSQLILLDKDENNLYEITCELREVFDAVVPVVADIRNADGLQKAFERHRPEVVFHAAAYKHVPLMEEYPAEAVLNNVMGTRNVAELSHAYGVTRFVLVSTDKAVNPSSTMGASKRIAEMILQRLAATGSPTHFCCVRFGNVLGSRASVVPLFQRQIRQGRSITVTHPDVRRYFMTIPEAVQLVIRAGSQGEKGEIFLLDMGDPVKIVDLARNLIELSGLVPERDVQIEFTGLRPGEKLTEELLVDGEQGVRSTRFSKIFVVAALEQDWSALPDAVRRLEEAAHAGDMAAIHEVFYSLNIGYANTRQRAASDPPTVRLTVQTDGPTPSVTLSPFPEKARA